MERIATLCCVSRESTLRHLVQCKHVEVTDVILLSVSDPGSAFFFIDHLSHIFTDKSSLRVEGIKKRK